MLEHDNSEAYAAGSSFANASPSDPFAETEARTGQTGDRTLNGRTTPSRDLVGEVMTYRAFCDTFGDASELLSECAIERPRLGRCALDRVLGSGAKGAVLGGEHLQLQRSIAMKVVRLDLDPGLDNADEQSRLMREAQALATLDHPNIVRVYDAGEEDGVFHIVMDHIKGQTLREAQRGRSWQEIVDLYLEAGRGLAAAHARDIVHRDFKPHNVLVSDDGEVRVADFGLAARGGVPTSEPASEQHNRATDPHLFNERITITGQTHGTPAYMPPEQFLGHCEPRSDLYAFCVSLYEALYGQLPWQADNWFACHAFKIEQDPAAVPLGTKVPKWLDRLIRSGLQVRIEDRPSSMDELLKALDYRVRRRKWLRAGALASTAGAFIVLAMALQTDPCANPGDEIAGVWSDRSDDIKREVAVLKDPRSDDSFAHLSEFLDKHTNDWTQSYSEVCAATFKEGTQSDELFDTRYACLDQRRRELSALVDSLSPVSPQSLMDGLKVAAQLGAPAQCRSASATPNPTPEQEVALKSLRDVLADATVLERSGAYSEADTKSEEAVKQAREIGFAPALAEALLAWAHTKMLKHDGEAARKRLDEALDLAEENRLHAVSADAASLLSKLAALELRDRALGEESARWASRKLRVSPDPWREAELSNNRGLLASSLDPSLADLERARKHHQRALDIRLSLDGESRLLRANSHQNLGNVFAGLGDLDSAFKHYEASRQLNSEVLGEHHPRVGDDLFNIAATHFYGQRLGKALPPAIAALTIYESAGSISDLPEAHSLLANIYTNTCQLQDAAKHAKHATVQLDQDMTAAHDRHARALDNLGSIHHDLSDYDEALDAFDRGLAHLKQTERSDVTRERISLFVNRAATLTDVGRYTEAHDDIRQALELAPDSRSSLTPLRAAALCREGRTYILEGQHALSLSHLEDALEILTRIGDSAVEAEASQLLAEAIEATDGDLTRARALATSALDHLRSDCDEERVRHVEALLEKINERLEPTAPATSNQK